MWNKRSGTRIREIKHNRGPGDQEIKQNRRPGGPIDEGLGLGKGLGRPRGYRNKKSKQDTGPGEPRNQGTE